MLYPIVYISVPSFSFTALLLYICSMFRLFCVHLSTLSPSLFLLFVAVPSCVIYSLLHLLHCTPKKTKKKKKKQKKKNKKKQNKTKQNKTKQKKKKKKKMSLCLALPNKSIPVVPYLYPPPNDFSFLVNAFMFLIYVPKHQDVSNTNTPRTLKLMLPV